MARLDHAAIFGFFPDAADGGQSGSMARRRCAAAESRRARSDKPLFRLGAAAPAWQLGAVSAATRSRRRGLRGPDASGRVDAGLAGAAPSPDLHAAQDTRRLAPPLRYSRGDLWPGGADRAGAPRRRIASRAAEEILL